MKTVTVARKPIVGTVANNVLTHGCGGLNIGSTRIGSGGDKTEGGCAGKVALHDGGIKNRTPVDQSVGRWPANLILQHLDGCRCEGVKKVTGTPKPYVRDTEVKNIVYGKEKGTQPKGYQTINYGDSEGNETVANWICEDGCPVRALDNQSGILKSGAMDSIATGGQYTTYGKMYERRVTNPASEGGASRFFKQIGENK